MGILKLMSVLIGQPLLALVPAALFFSAYAAIKSRLAFALGCLWTLYCIYELAMKYRLLCSGDCNIRIDLLAVYPGLLLASLAGLVTVGVAMFKRRLA